MKAILITFGLMLTLSFQGFTQKVFKTTNGTVSFYSKTPVEDIEATSKKLGAAINIDSRAIAFTISIKSFVFPQALMQEHFNEHYMESDKYPTATFKGKINENIDLSKDGTYKVTASGTLNMHGVEKPRDFEGTITVKGGNFTLNSNFKVKLEDHKIERPSVVFQNIAEVIDVKLNALFKPL